MGVSKNNGTPKSSILIGVFHYKPSILGTPIFGNTHIYIYIQILEVIRFVFIMCFVLSQALNVWCIEKK